ncbi:hypothetical protein [Pyrococcus yayanosii]|uniref:hypothetical protein n=1 Tax=Pyrococcus yayanosii TaxID=1008460 RepID=UPI00064FF327|nr:hypothetical protein [Pyrococcus yayanosii]
MKANILRVIKHHHYEPELSQNTRLFRRLMLFAVTRGIHPLLLTSTVAIPAALALVPKIMGTEPYHSLPSKSLEVKIMPIKALMGIHEFRGIKRPPARYPSGS